MYSRSPFQSRDRYGSSPANGYNAFLDDQSMSIELGRTVPQYKSSGSGYKETENLSDKDYFKMDDLFKKDRDEFLKQNEVDDEVTQKFRSNTFKIIEELPDNVASKYGDILTELTNNFVQQHLALKSKYNELLKSNPSSVSHEKREQEREFVIEQLTLKLKRYKSHCSELKGELNAKEELIASLQKETTTKEKPFVAKETNFATAETTSKTGHDSIDDESGSELDYSLLINQVKTGMSRIELEEEMRIKKELQQKEYIILRRQLEDLRNEKDRQGRHVLNRDLDQFKNELKSELGDMLKQVREPQSSISSTSSQQAEEKTYENDELFKRLKSLVEPQIWVSMQHFQEKFEKLLQNKVNRDELEFLLFKSNVPEQVRLKKSLSMLDLEGMLKKCKYCSHAEQASESSLTNDIDELTEKLKGLGNEISRLESNEELNEAEMMRLISERHQVKQQIKERKKELDSVQAQFSKSERGSSGPAPETEDGHTIDILRDNAKKFGIPLRKATA